MNTDVSSGRIERFAESVSLQGFAAFTLFVSLLGVGIVAAVLGVTTGIRSLYAVLGAGIVLIGTKKVDWQLEFAVDPMRLSKAALTLGLLGLSVSYLVGRTASLVVFVPGFLVVVGLVVTSEVRPRLAAVVVTVMYALFSLSKFVGTRYYYGNGDVLGHTLGVRQLLREGTGAITYTAYASFPGLHMTTAGIHLVSGLPVYVSYVLVGTTAMTVATAVVYLIYRLQFSAGQAAVVAVLLYATFEQTVFFSTYTFPQTLAFSFVLLVFYLALSLAAHGGGIGRYILAGLFAVASATTHHFTALLLFPAAGVIAAGQLFQGGLSLSGIRNSRPAHVLTGWVGVIFIYWLVVDDWIFDALGYTLSQNFLATGGSSEQEVASTTESASTAPQTITDTAQTASAAKTTTDTAQTTVDTVQTTTAAQTTSIPSQTPAEAGVTVDPTTVQTTKSVYAYGTTGPQDTIQRAIVSFAEPTLLYQVAVVALVLLGVYALASSEQDVSFPSLLLLGVGATAIIVRTPIRIWSMRRVQMVWVVFFVGFLAVGVVWALKERGTAIHVVVTVVLALAVVSGALGAADDVPAIELTDDKTREVSLGDDYNQYVRLASLVNRREANVSAPWIAGDTLHSFGAESTDPRFGEQVIVSNGNLLLVESDWADRMFKAEYESGIGLSKVYFSEESLQTLQSDENRVYTSGDVSLLYDNERIYRPAPPANQTAGIAGTT